MSVRIYRSDSLEMLQTQCSVNVSTTMFSTNYQLMDFVLINDAVVNILLFPIWIPLWDRYLKMGLLPGWLHIFKFLWAAAKLPTKKVIPIYRAEHRWDFPVPYTLMIIMIKICQCVRWKYLIFICIFLIISKVEYPFMCLWGICISSSEFCYFLLHIFC